MIIGYITGQALQIQAPVIVSDSINFLTAQFFFQTEDWRGLSKWAHFKQGENVYDFALENDRIEKDAHLNLSDGEWEIYLHGNEFADGEVVERITTEIVNLTVKKSGALEGEPFAEQPASEVERLNAKLDQFLETGAGGKVSSVNGKDGDVVLTAEDVGALPADTEIPTVPEKVSAFENDAEYQNAEQVREIAQDEAQKVEEKIPDIPTNVSSFVNDAEYQTADEVAATVNASAEAIEKKIPTIPKNVSEFTNDVRYQSAEQVQATVAGKAAEIVAQIPTVPTEISAFRNDAKYQTEEQLNAKALEVEAKIPTVPSNVSAFNNDADYATRTFVQETVNGKNIAFVFDSVADLDTWLSDAENVSRLKTGDVFWIRDTEVPDYWWDGENQTKQMMETTKVDLSAYALKAEIPVKTSDLQNDSDFATNAGVDTKLGGYQPKLSEYVQTVNGKSGDVNLTASDVGALPSTAQIEQIYTIPVTLELTDDNNDLYTSLPDGVYDEILQAHNDGKVILANCTVAFPGNDSGSSLDLRSTMFCVEKDAGGNVEQFSSHFVFYDGWTSIYEYTVNVSSEGYLWGKSRFLGPAERVHRGAPLLQETLDTDISTYYTTARAVHQVVNGLRTEFVAKSAVGKANGVASLDENGLIPSTQLPAVEEDTSCIFWVPCKLGDTGFELDGVTHADVVAAWNDGNRVIGKVYVPQEANMGIEGDFAIPLNYIRSDAVLVFGFVSGATSCEVFLRTDNSVFVDVKELEEAKEDTNSASVYYIDIAVESLSASPTLPLDPAVVAGAVSAYNSGMVVMVRNSKAAGIQFFELLECIGPQGGVVIMAFRVRKGSVTDAAETNAVAVVNIMQNMLFIDNNYA